MPSDFCTDLGSDKLTRCALAVYIFITSLFIINYYIRFNWLKSILYICLSVILILITILYLIIPSYFLINDYYLDSQDLGALLYTNPLETIEFILERPLFILGIICACSLGLVLSFTATKIKVKNLTILGAVFILSIIVMYKNAENPLTRFYYLIFDMQSEIQKFEQATSERKISQSTLISTTEPRTGLYVVIIGESANKHHMSAYGYSRNTTPWLSQAKLQHNSLLFQHAYSNYMQTVPALSYALTAKNQYNSINLYEAPSIIEAANTNGFTTYWISNQSKFGIHDTPTSIIANQADDLHFTNKIMHQVYDQEVLKQLPNLKELPPKALVIIHLMGSHATYNYRYPQSFNLFGQNTIDTYDNSIRYTDYVLSKIYDYFNKSSKLQAFIYFSDHAEDMKYAHDRSKYTSQMTHIPFFIQLNPKLYHELDSKLDGNLQAVSNYYFTNDLIYNTVLSLLNIKIKNTYESENDLFNPKYNQDKSRFKTMHGTKAIE